MAELKFFITGDAKDGEKALKSIDSKVQDVTASFAKWGVAAAAATAALSIKEAAEFEKKIAEVSTLLEDTSGLEGIEQAVKDLAIEYGQFPDEQVESIYSIISAGASDAAEAVQTLEAANKLALGGVTDVAIAADGLTSILNAYGEAAGTTTEVSDAMFVAMKAGKTTIGELSHSIGNVAPIAAEAGVELDELLAATAALTKGGVTTNIAMTGLRQVVVSILKPTSEAQKEAKKLGLEFNSTALESKGLQGFLADLIDKTDGNKDSLTQLFGSVEALAPVFALTGSQADSFTEIMESMDDKTGATDEALSKMQETGDQALRRLAALGNVAAITFGDQLLPVVADVANFLIGPTTKGVNKVEDAFFFLKTAAFSVLGGVSELILDLLTPLSKVEGFFSKLTGIEIAGITGVTEEIELFAAAMEEGAIETFRAKDAAEQHNIELREKADLLRALDEEEAAIRKKKLEEDTAEEEIEKAAVKAAQLTEIEKKASEDRIKIEKNAAAAIKSIKTSIAANAIALSKQLFGESKASAIAGIALNKATAIAAAWTSAVSGSGLAFASQLVPGDPTSIIRAEIARNSVLGLGKINMGLIAATGLGEIAGQAHDGMDEVPRDGSFNLKKGEMVLNPGNSDAVRDAAISGAGGTNIILEEGAIQINALDPSDIIMDEIAQKLIESFQRLLPRGIVVPT